MRATFGEFIRNLRIQKGLTLTQLAARLDIDSANLSKIETGKRIFDYKKLPQLAQEFSLPIDQLRSELISEEIAKDLVRYGCSEETLALAEEKVKYIRIKQTSQGEIDF